MCIRDSYEKVKLQPHVMNTMHKCMSLAKRHLPEMIKNHSVQAEAQSDNLSEMLGIARQMQSGSELRFKSPGLIAKKLNSRMDELKGFHTHTDATGAEPPLKQCNNFSKSYVPKWKCGLVPEGLQEKVLPSNIPPRHRKPKAKGNSLESKFMTMESVALNLATASEVNYNLMRLMMATIFTKSEDGSNVYNDETEPVEVETILRGMFEANQAVISASTTLLGESLIWRRQEALFQSTVPVNLRQGLLTAPFNKETLFGHKPMQAVLSESDQDKFNRAITTMSFKKPAQSQKRGGYFQSNQSVQRRGFGDPAPPTKLQRTSSQGSRGRPSRRRGSRGRQHPQ